MNVIKISVLVIVLGFASCKSDQTVKVEGKVPGLQSGEMVSIMRIAASSDSAAAETVSVPVDEKGNFSAEVSVNKGRGDVYRVWSGSSPGPSQSTVIYLEAGNAKIEAKSGKLLEAVFSGTQNLAVWNDFIIGSSNALKLAEEERQQQQGYEPIGIFISRFIRSHDASPAVTAILEYFGKSQGLLHADTVVALYKKRAPSSMNNLPGQRLKQWITETADVMPGKPAPIFSMPDTSGTKVSLSDFKGKYVLLDFWASWCGPCRKENPHLVKAYQQFKDKGFTILGVSLDQPGGKNAWLAAIRKDGLTWTQLSELNYFDNSAAQMYHLTSIPSNFLIDPQGVIVARNLRGEEVGKRLAELLDK